MPEAEATYASTSSCERCRHAFRPGSGHATTAEASEPFDNSRLDLRRGLSRESVLPEPENHPTFGREDSVGLDVARGVGRDLRTPVIMVRRRQLEMIRTAVPKAAIEEDGDSRTGEDQIGRATNRGNRSHRDAVPEAPRMHR